MINSTRGEHTNHYTMDAVNKINILSSFDSCHVLDLNINIFFP